jgi:hypothetical protein
MQMPSSVSTRLQYRHKSLLDILDGLSDEQIRKQLNPGKWSIFENIVHLQTYQHTLIVRIRRILEEECPSFPLTTRKELSSGILSFKGSDLEKTACHSSYGKMNLVQWLNFFLLHEAHHLFTIFKMGTELKKS